MTEADDTYKTLDGRAEAVFKDRSSKFLAYACHVESEEEIKQTLDALRKRHYDATHCCYAWRLGPRGEASRANDDGEPSGTAGRPILGQLLSNELTDTLIAVVRYFGGTKLGVPGLINAYRESADAAIAEGRVEERTVDVRMEITFSYLTMNDVMCIVKEEQPRIAEQTFDNLCRMTLSIRASRSQRLAERLGKVEGLGLEVKN